MLIFIGFIDFFSSFLYFLSVG